MGFFESEISRKGHRKRGICLSNSRQICDNLAHPPSDARNEIPATLRSFGAQFATNLRNAPFANAPLLGISDWRPRDSSPPKFSGLGFTGTLLVAQCLQNLDQGSQNKTTRHDPKLPYTLNFCYQVSSTLQGPGILSEHLLDRSLGLRGRCHSKLRPQKTEAICRSWKLGNLDLSLLLRRQKTLRFANLQLLNAPICNFIEFSLGDLSVEPTGKLRFSTCDLNT